MKRSQGSSSAPGRGGSNSREVNNLLHTLRGEHYRHEQNQRRTTRQTALPSSRYTPPVKQTLPISQIFGEEEDGISEVQVQPHHPPDFRDRDNSGWRKRALSLLFSHVPLMDNRTSTAAHDASTPRIHTRSEDAESTLVSHDIPSLTVLCLRLLVAYCTSPSAFQDVVQYLPSHLRRILLRDAAVHAPLTTSKLYALCEDDDDIAGSGHGHVDGELVVVGPYAWLPKDHFTPSSDPEAGASGVGTANEADGGRGGMDVDDDATEPGIIGDEDSGSWESTSSDRDPPPPLTSLALVLTHLPVPTLFTFPPTITHLALLSLPTLTPIHRLPRLLPLLEFLDLSYNFWLGQPKIVSNNSHNNGSGKAWGDNLLERTEWGRWAHLKVLGLRECGIRNWEVALRKVNEGRWVDVEVVGADLEQNIRK